MGKDLREHQLICIEALDELDKICRKHKIKYFLVAGSVLGAIRHKGFIPWDDDIDVGLTYEDFYKLREILPTELDEKFIYVDDTRNDDYVWMFGKIMFNEVCCIDLFLISKWPTSRISAFIRWQIRRLAVEFRKYSLHYNLPPVIEEKNPIKKVKVKIVVSIRKIIYLMLKPFFNAKDFSKFARQNEKKLEELTSYLYINLYSIYPRNKEVIKKEWIENIEFHEFEGKRYPCVGNYDEYLTHLYGDYMKLPPINEQIASHFKQNSIE